MSTQSELPGQRSREADLGKIGQLEDEVRQLTAALTSRPVIEQAKGMLMLHFSVDSETAFRVLLRWSSHTNTKVAVLAHEVATAAIEGGDVAVARLVLDIPHRAGPDRNGAQATRPDRAEND